MEGAWSASAFNPQVNKVETRWLTILSQSGTEVRGTYFSSSAQFDRRFAGTLGNERSLTLRLEDQTIEFDGVLPDGVRAAGAAMPVVVKGGSASGTTLTFVPVFEGMHPGFDPVVVIHGLEQFEPFALPYEYGLFRWIPLTASRIVNGVTDDCTNSGTWESSDPQVAAFGTGSLRSSINGFAVHEGTTTIRVNCDGLVGATIFTVNRWTLRVRVIDGATGQAIPGVDWKFAEVTPLRSNSAGEFADRQVGDTSLSVAFFHPGYQFHQGQVSWNRTPAMTETVTLTPISGTLVAEADVPDNDQLYKFTVSRAGTLRLS